MATKRVAAGQLTERVTLVTPGASAPDGQGGNLPGGPDTTREVWARVEPLSAGQTLAVGLVLDLQAYRVTVRAEVGTVTAAQRLTWKGRTLAIKAATAAEVNTYTTLLCQDSGQ